MAKKKDGITDLTKLSVIAAEKFTPSQFKLFQSTIVCYVKWCSIWLY